MASGLRWSFGIIESDFKYPKLFQSLNGLEKSYFKVPKGMRDAKFQFKYAWIFPWGKGLIGLVMGSPTLYLLDTNYQAREQLESDSVETEKINKVLLKIDGLNNETFTPKTLMSKDEYIAALKEWFPKKVLIQAAWISRHGLTLACGDQESATISFLDPFFEVQTLKGVQGRMLIGHGDSYWIRHDVGATIIVETWQLP